MQITELSLRHFRSYRELRFDVPSGVVIFVGSNGEGKTNLLESIHLLLRGTSFRHGTPEAFVRSGEVSGMARVKIVRRGLAHEIQWTFKEGHRLHEWNGKRATGLQLAREFPLVLFSPESLAAIKEGPDHRRRLVDELLMTHSGAAVGVIREFEKALKTRNRVLRDFKKGLKPAGSTERLLESLDPIFLPLGAELTWLRLEALRALEPDLEKAFRFVCENVGISVDYVISDESARGWSREQVMDALHQKAQVRRKAEMESGQSLIGPQRHDIRFLFAGKDSRYFCSQGQQRAMILSYKMAQIMYHHRTHQVYPFLLLDDVLSELDPTRRTNLVKFLKETPSQIFLTTTDLSFSLDFGERSLSVFRIDKGVISGARDTESL